MKICILAFLLFLVFDKSPAQERKFSFTGSPVVTLFANYHTGLGHANAESGFELDRSYLGYQFRVSNSLSGKVIFDIGPTKVKGADLERVAYVKNTMLSWETGNFTLDFGLVKTEQFSLQESFWGYRYILKSFNDAYKFSPSADMGVIGKYKFSDRLKADLSFTNGEGYKKLNQDNHYRYGAGITFLPSTAITLRAYYDLYTTGQSDTTSNQQAFSLFAGYKRPEFYIGAEYNYRFNPQFLKDQDQYGFSFFASCRLTPKFSTFARYDNLQSSDNRRLTNGQRFLTGIQYRPVKYLKLAPNFSNWNPYTGRASSFIYLNLEFKL